MAVKKGMASRGSGKGGLGRGIGSLFPTNYIRKDNSENPAEEQAEKPSGQSSSENSETSNNINIKDEKRNKPSESRKEPEISKTRQAGNSRSKTASSAPTDQISSPGRLNGSGQTAESVQASASGQLNGSGQTAESVQASASGQLNGSSQTAGSGQASVSGQVSGGSESESLTVSAAGSDVKPSPAASAGVNGYGADSAAGTADGQVVMLKIRQIESNKNQPRKKFDEDSLTELAESIRNYGVLQPVLVQKSGDFYEIVAGERRWRAARMAGLKEIPAIVCDYSEQEKAQVTLIENLQREDLDPIEEAQAYKTLIETYHLTQDEIADRLSRSRTVITNSLRLLKLNAEVQKMLSEGLITQGHAKVLLGIPNGEVQLDLANKIMDEGLSVRETEKIVKQLLNKKPPKPVRELSNQSLYNEYEEKLRNRIGTKVTIQRKAESKGRVEIEYYSDEDLQKILDLIGI